MIRRMETIALIGRERELEALDALIDGVAQCGAALVVRGDPGIGKSSLLTAAREMASTRAFMCVATTGVQSETHLPFAGLQQLLQPLLDRVDELPAPQRTALE